MAALLRLSGGAFSLALLLVFAQAGKIFWLFRQHVEQQRTERAAKEVYFRRLQLLAQRPALPSWSPPLEGAIHQPLDHFNWQHRVTFKQRFWINEQHWQRPLGPVFLYIGGEAALSQFSVLTGHHVELAEMHGALLVALEHRFYGASLNPDGLQDPNLQFLSSQQALSDLVAFRHFIVQKYELTETHVWICFGGSYPGSLAAWLRLKFPHLFFAAVASSAPVRAQLDFTGYNEVVAASLSNPLVGGSEECLKQVAEAFSAVDGLVRAGRLAKLAADFQSCAPLEGPSDCLELVGNLADVFKGAVQYDHEGAGWDNVATLCSVMTNSTIGSAYQRLVTANLVFLILMELKCVDNSHAALLEELRSAHISTVGVGIRQWHFQSCTEFGYFQTCEDRFCPFSHLMNLSSQLDVCTQVFNVSSRSAGEAVSFTNDYYGANHPKASQVLFVNGDIDPWHALSVLQNQSVSELAILINGTAHCADMLSSKPSDPSPLVHAREQISFWVAEWLKLASKVR